MLIYFKKEKRSTTRYYKNKIEKYYNCQFPRIQTYKDEFKKKNQLTKRSLKKQNGKKNQVRSTKLMSERSCERDNPIKNKMAG
jgi:hypothetical protein